MENVIKTKVDVVTLKELINDKKELDAILSVYKRNKGCDIIISDTVYEYNLTKASKAASIIYIIEAYYKLINKNN